MAYPTNWARLPGGLSWTVLARFAVMDGNEIRDARERLGLTQEQLASALGVGPRTIGNWERGGTVPKNRMGMIRRFFAEDHDESALYDPLRGASDLALLGELTRRTIERQNVATTA